MRVPVLACLGLGVVALAWPAKPVAPRTPRVVETRSAHVADTTLGGSVTRARDVAPSSAPSELTADVAARWSSIEAMVRDGDLAQLPGLEAAELAKEPEAAPAIIHGLASLAVQGSDDDRAVAAKTLVRWLRAESARAERSERDAVGNVVNIVEALGDLGGDDAVTALIDVLEHAEDLALRTTACDRLATLGDARALPAVDRFSAGLARMSEPADDFERELRVEAIKTAADATARLRVTE